MQREFNWYNFWTILKYFIFINWDLSVKIYFLCHPVVYFGKWYFSTCWKKRIVTKNILRSWDMEKHSFLSRDVRSHKSISFMTEWARYADKEESELNLLSLCRAQKRVLVRNGKVFDLWAGSRITLDTLRLAALVSVCSYLWATTKTCIQFQTSR